MTLNDFYQRVAQRLGVLPVSGSLSAEDAELIGSAYQALLYELSEHSLADWADDDEVPDQFADVMIGMVAAGVVDEFTIPEPRRSQMIAQYGWGLPVASVNERRLRAMTRAGSSDDGVIEFY